MRSNPAYTAAAVEMPTVGAGSSTSNLTVTYGDFNFEGNVNEDTVEAFRAALRENTDYIQELVYNRSGMQKVESRLTINRGHVNQIARHVGVKW